MRREVDGTAPYRTMLYHATDSVRAHQPCRDEIYEEASICIPLYGGLRTSQLRDAI
jgi:hypothetical protein